MDDHRLLEAVGERADDRDIALATIAHRRHQEPEHDQHAGASAAGACAAGPAAPFLHRLGHVHRLGHGDQLGRFGSGRGLLGQILG